MEPPFKLPPAERPQQPSSSPDFNFNFNCGENPPLEYLIEVLEMSKILFEVPSISESDST